MKKKFIKLLIITPLFLGCDVVSTSEEMSSTFNSSSQASEQSSSSSSEQINSSSSTESELSSSESSEQQSSISSEESSSSSSSEENSSSSSSLSDFQIWKNSQGEDLNNDGRISDKDYQIYLTHHQFKGTFIVNNYNYEGTKFAYGDNGVRLDKFGTYLTCVTFSVDNAGRVSGTLSDSTLTEMGSDAYVAKQFIKNSVFNYEDSEYTIDTKFSYKNYTIPLSIPLTTTDNKTYSSQIEITKDSYSATISFDIVYND